jgi:hypothetical protein
MRTFLNFNVNGDLIKTVEVSFFPSIPRSEEGANIAFVGYVWTIGYAYLQSIYDEDTSMATGLHIDIDFSDTNIPLHTEKAKKGILELPDFIDLFAK